jgi:uncharacterized membrane protein
MTAASSALRMQASERRSSAENTTRLSIPLERLGFWSAALAAVLTVVWTVAALVTAVVWRPASWAGIDAYAAQVKLTADQAQSVGERRPAPHE